MLSSARGCSTRGRCSGPKSAAITSSGLAGPGVVRRVVVDASCFIGNAPGAVSVRGADLRAGAVDDVDAWTELVPRTRVQPDTRHQFPVSTTDVVTHVRLDVFPDGGLARLRVLGELV